MTIGPDTYIPVHISYMYRKRQFIFGSVSYVPTYICAYNSDAFIEWTK